MLNIKVTENEERMGPQGQAVPWIVSQTEFATGGDAYGETPNGAIDEVLKKLRGFLEKMNMPEFRKES
jgi:hypothetical protein